MKPAAATIKANADHGPASKALRARGGRFRSQRRFSVAWREFRESAAIMIALAVIDFALETVTLINHVYFRYGTPEPEIEYTRYQGVWLWTGVIAAMFLGVACGALGEENGTADFEQRLPASRGRILAEKLAGAAGAFAVWGALALGLIWIALHGGGVPMTAAWWRGFLLDDAALQAATRAALLFASGFACAAFTRRLLPACILTLFAASLPPLLINWALYHHPGLGLPDNPWPMRAVMLMFFAAGAWRFMTREGK